MKQIVILVLFYSVIFSCPLFAESTMPQDGAEASAKAVILDQGLEHFFDDRMLIEGYAARLKTSPKDVLLAMANDETLYAYKKAAAVRVFRERFAPDAVLSERVIIERVLMRQLERSDSVFVQVEAMHTLLMLDRYRYFDAMVPALVRKLDHYDPFVSDMTYKALEQTVTTGAPRVREARIVFNTLRKMFFLSRKKLNEIAEDDVRLKNKLALLRWAVKVLGTGELKNLPKEVISRM